MTCIYLIGLLALSLGACSTPRPGSPEAQAYLMKKQHEATVAQVKTTLGQLPDWYADLPKDDLSLYGQGTATSGDLQFALDKAVLVAKAEIASRLKDKLSSEMHDFISDTGPSSSPVTGQRSERVIKDLVAQANIGGYHVAKTEIRAAGSGYRAFVLVQYPLGEANRMVVDQMKKDAAIDLRTSSTKAFAQLDRDVSGQREEHETPVPDAAPQEPVETEAVP